MASKALIPFLVIMMLVTGDMQCVRNCESPDPEKRKVFEQPVVQTLQMFIGEMGCWLVVFGCNIWNQHISNRFGASSEASLFADGYRPVDGAGDDLADSDDEVDSISPLNGRGRRQSSSRKLSSVENDGRMKLKGWKVFLLAAPACCDITGTTLMNVGLLFVVASIYQMTRGALVLFVGLFSVLFLRRKLYLYQWIALFVVVLGVGIVGLAGVIFKDHKPEALEGVLQSVVQLFSRGIQEEDLAATTPVAVKTIIGVLLIAGAQIFTAGQFVLEEWILEKYAMDPLNVVGWEGVFGFLVTLVGMLILHLAIGRTDSGRHGYFDVREGWHNMTTNRAVAVSSVLIMISIGGFNFFGLSVTRSVSATSRSTIDTCRTLFIWIISLCLGWESFKWLQVVGFAMLVYGTFLFNDIINPPLKACLPSSPHREELLPQEPIEHI
ncbi:integral membrane protein [Paracoccidioides lutzii Pb01]|uniref:Integral membrane protein n=1 Tax=Paracoccidioides lutzii (strain ATCC MYA-826 / Pb01) TaxID=502779 RepID=C1GTJ8_PARBA|nr:integral membrane protein [Paracoccidioides lutzii Pb01]EEH39654.2 integral membrane protein [Paracoccidioides lutzii Pb01]